MPERQPAGESKPDGITERTVGLVAGQAGALKVTLEHRIGIKVPSDARILYMPAKSARGGIRNPRPLGVFVGNAEHVE